MARLRYALADSLLGAGKDAEARRWFAAAAKLDPEQETDAQQRVDELDGMLIDFDEDDDERDRRENGPRRRPDQEPRSGRARTADRADRR